MHTPGITWPETGLQGFLESLLNREAGGSPAGPSLSRAPPDGAEQGMAGLDRAGQGSGPWEGLMVADRVLPPACRWGAP